MTPPTPPPMRRCTIDDSANGMPSLVPVGSRSSSTSTDNTGGYSVHTTTKAATTATAASSSFVTFSQSPSPSYSTSSCSSSGSSSSSSSSSGSSTSSSTLSPCCYPCENETENTVRGAAADIVPEMRTPQNKEQQQQNEHQQQQQQNEQQQQQQQPLVLLLEEEEEEDIENSNQEEQLDSIEDTNETIHADEDADNNNDDKEEDYERNSHDFDHGDAPDDLSFYFRPIRAGDRVAIQKLHEEWFPVRYHDEFYDDLVHNRMTQGGIPIPLYTNVAAAAPLSKKKSTTTTTRGSDRPNSHKRQQQNLEQEHYCKKDSTNKKENQPSTCFYPSATTRCSNNNHVNLDSMQPSVLQSSTNSRWHTGAATAATRKRKHHKSNHELQQERCFTGAPVRPLHTTTTTTTTTTSCETTSTTAPPSPVEPPERIVACIVGSHVDARRLPPAMRELLLPDDTKYKRLFYIMTLGTVQEYRKAGLATLLIEQCIETQIQTDPSCGCLYLHVITFNHTAISFYERLGFYRVQEIPNYYNIDGKNYNCYLYAKYFHGNRGHRADLFRLFSDTVRSIWNRIKTRTLPPLRYLFEVAGGFSSYTYVPSRLPASPSSSSTTTTTTPRLMEHGASTPATSTTTITATATVDLNQSILESSDDDFDIV